MDGKRNSSLRGLRISCVGWGSIVRVGVERESGVSCCFVMDGWMDLGGVGV